MSGHVRGHLFLRVLFDTHLHHYPLAYEIVIFVRGRLVDSATVRTAGVRSGAAVVAPGTAVVALRSTHAPACSNHLHTAVPT